MTELEEREQETKKRGESEKGNANVVMYGMGEGIMGIEGGGGNDDLRELRVQYRYQHAGTRTKGGKCK